MNRVPQQKPLSKAEFHRQLREWFTTTVEAKVGPESVDGRTRWIHVRSGDHLYVMHADTTRKSIQWYLDVVDKYGDEISWKPAASRRGKMTAVVYGPDLLRNAGLYLYLAAASQPVATALFINGMFEKTLEEITAAQLKRPSGEFFLQPYSARIIKLLADSDPSPTAPIRLYMSLSTALSVVSYRADIIGWQDKTKLTANQLTDLNMTIRTNQPSDQEIYQEIAGKPCVNLIRVTGVERFKNTIPVSCLVKQGDQNPLKPRTQSGGWSYVFELPDWLGTTGIGLETEIDLCFKRKVEESLRQSSEARCARLATAQKKPARLQMIALRFQRNPDVVAEVLYRANGLCECCGAQAPFARASNGLPYLEVHHKKMLSDDGEDTVENAMATCPNCHRRLHFGTLDQS